MEDTIEQFIPFFNVAQIGTEIAQLNEGDTCTNLEQESGGHMHISQGGHMHISQANT